MGLRAGEVTGLTLDDIDWRAGELTVRGKGDERARLPLPADVGEAVVGYLRYGRARTAGHLFITVRHRFITVRAPFTRLARNTSVCGIVRQGMPARRDRSDRAAPAAARGRVRPAGRRRFPGGDRAAAAAPQPAGHRDLRGPSGRTPRNGIRARWPAPSTERTGE